ncbi:MAG: MG2 domain-containing protein, partial [Planctomycetota bacterium]
SVSNIFLPGSEIQFNLNWRNVAAIDLTLHRVDITRDLDPTQKQIHLHGWVQQIDISNAGVVKAWTFDTKDTGEHRQGHEQVRLDEPLAPGAYVLEAMAGGQKARELVLVTDVSVVLKSWAGQVVAYVCDALDGAPIPGARVRIWDYRYTKGTWTGSDEIARSDRDGLTQFKVRTDTRSREHAYGVLVTVAVDGRQAFAVGDQVSARARGLTWKVYATTDRPAYRPDETVHWKVTARTNDGTGYAVPSDQVLHYEVHGPRGKITDGDMTLNAFGSAWTDLDLDSSMALGEYQVRFSSNGRGIGTAQLFRLEEYKLPEFEVTVTTPSGPEGGRKAYLVGEPVEVAIDAGYYFGGPVAAANVELVVYQKPYYHWWMPVRDYPWYYDAPRYHYWGGPGQIIKRETIKTDEAGRASAVFDTPAGGGQDFEYTIEARVTDASRREVTGVSRVRVTRQRYYVHPHPVKTIYQPGETVEVEIKTIDANQQPVSVEGKVQVTRERWVEVWLDPAGREVTGSALEDTRRRFKAFPPPDDGWRLKFRGYTSQEILTRSVRTDAEGEATLAFEANDEGYYRITWRSDDPGAGPPP